MGKSMFIGSGSIREKQIYWWKTPAMARKDGHADEGGIPAWKYEQRLCNRDPCQWQASLVPRGDGFIWLSCRRNKDGHADEGGIPPSTPKPGPLLLSDWGPLNIPRRCRFYPLQSLKMPRICIGNIGDNPQRRRKKPVSLWNGWIICYCGSWKPLEHIGQSPSCPG